MKRAKLPLLLLALVLPILLTACDEDATAPETIYGPYSLETVEGQFLPVVVVQSGDDTLEITAGRITLNADGTFSTSLTLRETVGGAVTTRNQSETGTYTVNNSAYRFNYADGDTDTGSLTGQTLTLTSNGVTLVFEKV